MTILSVEIFERVIAGFFLLRYLTAPNINSKYIFIHIVWLTFSVFYALLLYTSDGSYSIVGRNNSHIFKHNIFPRFRIRRRCRQRNRFLPFSSTPQLLTANTTSSFFAVFKKYISSPPSTSTSISPILEIVNCFEPNENSHHEHTRLSTTNLWTSCF